MKRLGVFATAQEIVSLKELLSTPLLLANGVPPMRPAEAVHAYALTHGLPDVQGHYGCDLRTGEFLEWEDSDG